MIDSEINCYIWEPNDEDKNQVSLKFEIERDEIVMRMSDYTENLYISKVLTSEEAKKLSKLLALMSEFLNQ